MPNPAEMPLDIDNLSRFVSATAWMARSKDWKLKLLHRLAKAQLDVLTREALAGEPKKPGFAQRVEQKRKG